MFRGIYAKSQLEGKSFMAKTIITIGILLFVQNFFAKDLPLFAFILPFVLWYFQISLINTVIKLNPDSELTDQWKFHSAEHWNSNIYNGISSFYSYGCSNAIVPMWLIINLILVWFMPIPLAFVISGLLTSEIIVYMYKNQNGILAKLYYPLLIITQNWTLLKPDEIHMIVARQTRNALIFLEGENNEVQSS